MDHSEPAVLPRGLEGMSAEELARHQNSSTYVGPDDPWHGPRIGTFSMPNRRPATVRHGVPSHPQFSSDESWSPASVDQTHHTFPMTAAATAAQSPSNGSAEASVSHEPTQPQDMLDAKTLFQRLVQDMPLHEGDSARYQAYTELIKMKTRSLELDIAVAKQKEREADLELAQFRAVVDPLIRDPDQPTQAEGVAQEAQSSISTGMLPAQPMDQHFNVDAYPFDPELAMSLNAQFASDPVPPATTSADLSLTTFDFDSLLQSANLDMDGLLSWLPSMDTQSGTDLPTTLDPSRLHLSDSEYTVPAPVEATDVKRESTHSLSNAAKRRLSSPEEAVPTANSTSKKPKKGGKRGTLEDSAICASCYAPLLRVMVRATAEELPKSLELQLHCRSCRPVECMNSPPEVTAGSHFVTLEVRKRLRISMEIEDEEHHAVDRRVFCDVCQRLVASGQVKDASSAESVLSMAEIICPSCDGKYQRCTDCGGGGGSRIGIGKWRMKQVFPPGRKTCSLSHNRLGDRHREIGVHFTPTDLTSPQLKEVLSRCQALWREKTLARWAVPDMFEVDLPPGLANPLQGYKDVENVVNTRWPSRESMIKAEGADPSRFKRCLCLIWTHSQPRKSIKTVDLEEEHAKFNEDRSGSGTVLPNVSHTEVIIPPGSDLVGMWGGEWDMEQGSLLISTLVPFEGADGDDSTALSVGEMITKVHTLRAKINEERSASGHGDPLPQCQHLWVVSGNTMPLVRERVAEVLIKKRSFVPLEEYLTRHPDFINAVKARPRGMHPEFNGPLRGADSSTGSSDPVETKPLILVRWLGNDFGAQRVLEIKQQEFGGGPRAKRKAKGKR